MIVLVSSLVLIVSALVFLLSDRWRVASYLIWLATNLECAAVGSLSGNAASALMHLVVSGISIVCFAIYKWFH